MRYVIIGASAAGLAAAKTLRNEDPDSIITLISKDTAVHSRCMLHHYISHHRDEQALSFVPDDFFEQYPIEWVKGVEATHIDPATQQVMTSNGNAYAYDQLLIATGATAFIPPIPHLRDSKNVFVFRDLSDAQAIDKALTPTSKAIIIGAGLVGLDLASGLLERGIHTTVIEMADRLLPLQLDPISAKSYQEKFEAKGCHFLLGAKVTAATTHTNGRISGIVLESGEHIDCDLVVVSVGVRCNTTLVDGTSIQIDRGIKVDESLRTSIPTIYAAGDVCGLSGIWPNAVKQGHIAALNMTGTKTTYDDTYAIKNTINFYGLPTLSIGRILEQDDDEVLICEDQFVYKKIILNQNKVQGVIFQGEVHHTGIWQHLIKNQITLPTLNKSLFDLSFADFYGLEEETGKYYWSV